MKTSPTFKPLSWVCSRDHLAFSARVMPLWATAEGACVQVKAHEGVLQCEPSPMLATWYYKQLDKCPFTKEVSIES